MSDETKQVDLAVTMLELNRLDPSPTQPRKRFDQEKLDQLTESMREHGFTLSALTVRPKPGDSGKNGDSRFEIVTGERRARAANAAGIVKAPCFVRDLSDEEVVEQQLIENVQREDLTPIEEAEGYKQILALVHPGTGKKVYTIASLAKRIGKKERYIFDSLALCNLDPTTKAEVESGRLAKKTAGLIGRVPEESQRRKFAEQVLHPQKEEGPLSHRKAEELMHREFIRDLRVATFDPEDPNLLPVEEVGGKRLAGGACTDCPFRAGNTAAAGDVAKQKHSICLNPSCYDRKQAAEWVTWQAANTDPEKKRIALSEVQCKKMFAYGNQIAPESGLVDLSDHPDTSDLKAGEDSPGTWRTLVAGAEIQVFVVRDRFMKLRELVKRDMALEAARTINKHTVFKTAQRDKPKPEETRRQEEKVKERDRETDQAVLLEITGEIQKRKIETSATMLAFLRFLVDREISAINPTADFAKRYHLPVGGSVINQLAKRPAGELIALMVDLIISEGGYCTDVHDDDKKWLKSIFQIDHKAIEKRVTEERAKPAKGGKWSVTIAEKGEIVAHCPRCKNPPTELNPKGGGIRFADRADYESMKGSLGCSPACGFEGPLPKLSTAKATIAKKFAMRGGPARDARKRKAGALKIQRKAKKS